MNRLPCNQSPAWLALQAHFDASAKNFDLRQDFTFFHTVDDRNVLRYQGSVIGVSNPQLRVTDYVAQVHYRYRLNREWLFFELNPQLHFPRDKNYDPSPALSMRLEVLFDDSR